MAAVSAVVIKGEVLAVAAKGEALVVVIKGEVLVVAGKGEDLAEGNRRPAEVLGEDLAEGNRRPAEVLGVVLEEVTVRVVMELVPGEVVMGQVLVRVVMELVPGEVMAVPAMDTEAPARAMAAEVAKIKIQGAGKAAVHRDTLRIDENPFAAAIV